MPSETTNLPTSTGLRIPREPPTAMPRADADYVVSIGGTDRTVLFPTRGCVSGEEFQTFASHSGANGTEQDDLLWRCSYWFLQPYVGVPLREAWASAFDAWKALPTIDSWTRVLHAQRAMMAAAIESAQRTRMRNAVQVQPVSPSANGMRTVAFALIFGGLGVFLSGAWLYSRRTSSGVSGLRRKRRNRRKRAS